MEALEEDILNTGWCSIGWGVEFTLVVNQLIRNERLFHSLYSVCAALSLLHVALLVL